MELNITFKQMTTSSSARAYAEEKSAKLKKYFDGNLSISWNFTAQKQGYVAHCHLVGNRMDYFGEAHADSLLSSIDLALSKVEKQIKKHKEIVTEHKGKKKVLAA